MDLRIRKPEDWDGQVAIILAHGAGQGIDSPFMKFFHEELAGKGYLSVMFNFEYMEQKRKAPDPQAKMQARFRSVIEAVAGKHKPRFIVIGGKSMGGRVASYIVEETPEVHGVVFLGYPLHPPGKPEQIRDAHLYAIDRPLLFISGTRDPFAPRGLLDSVAKRLGGKATLVWIEGGDHSLRTRGSGQQSLHVAVESIRQWVSSRVT